MGKTVSLVKSKKYLQWWSTHLPDTLVDINVRMRNLSDYYKEIADVCFCLYSKTNFGSNDRLLRKLGRPLTLIEDWLRQQEQAETNEKFLNLTQMIENVRAKISNFR